MEKVLIWGKSAYFWEVEDFAFYVQSIPCRLLHPQLSTFLLKQKGCAYHGKSAYYDCAYYEWAEYIEF